MVDTTPDFRDPGAARAHRAHRRDSLHAFARRSHSGAGRCAAVQLPAAPGDPDLRNGGNAGRRSGGCSATRSTTGPRNRRRSAAESAPTERRAVRIVRTGVHADSVAARKIATVLGFRFGAAAYLTDHSEIPEESKAKLQGLDVLFLDALRHRPHPTHSTVERSLGWVEELKPRRAYFHAHLPRSAACSARRRRCRRMCIWPTTAWKSTWGREAECGSREALAEAAGIRTLGGDHRKFRRRSRRPSASVSAKWSASRASGIARRRY